LEAETKLTPVIRFESAAGFGLLALDHEAPVQCSIRVRVVQSTRCAYPTAQTSVADSALTLLRTRYALHVAASTEGVPGDKTRTTDKHAVAATSDVSLLNSPRLLRTLH